MSRTTMRWVGLAGVMLAFTVAPIQAQQHRLGGGVHYWRTAKDLSQSDFDVKEDGLAYMASYQFVPTSLLKLELDLEILPDSFANVDDTIFAPQAFVLLGSGIYGGLGIGTFVIDGEYSDEPFYVLRAGIDLELLPRIRLDVNANYSFTDFNSIKTVDEDVDTDTITLGAMIRIEL